VDVLGYDDAAEAFMDDTDGPMRITRIVLRPVIRVAVGTDVDEVVRLVHRGHDLCFIANSLNSTIEIEPRIVF
jgi:organic hydroperoxide reductase OsmC/OhrA